MNLIYQVAIGKSNLYDQCIQSVGDYAYRIGANHIVQTEPILKIRPDMKVTNRSYEAIERLGYLPIFEKEEAFNLKLINTYKNIAVIDADVFVKKNVKENIFDSLKPEIAFGAMREMDLPMQDWYAKKLKTYSQMQYGNIWPQHMFENGIAKFRNMGVMIFNTTLIKKIY